MWQVSIFSGYILEQKLTNLTQFRLSEIHNQPDPNERNGSLDMWQPEMWRNDHKCFLIV